MEGLWFIAGYFAGVSCVFLITAGVLKYFGVKLIAVPDKGDKA